MDGHRHPVSIRGALIALALVLVVPLAATMGYVVWLQAVEHKRQIGEAMLAEASVLGRALELRVATATAAVEALSQSQYIDDRNFAVLHSTARRIVASNDDALLNVALFAPDGTQLFNTLRPYGEPLPNAFEQERVTSVTESGLPRTSSRWIREAFATGKPVLSDLFFGLTAQRPQISVHVPVLRDGKVLYVWSCNFAQSALAAMLQNQAGARNWLATFIDRSGFVVARYPKNKEFFGVRASAALRASITRSSDGFAEGLTLEGITTYRAHVTTKDGWVVAVAVPKHLVDQQFDKGGLWWGTTTAGFLAAAFALVLWLGRQVATPLRRLSDAAGGIAEGRLPQLDMRIREIAALRDSLAEAAQGKRIQTRLALLEGLVQHAPVGVAVFDRDLKFVDLNERAALVDGLTVQQHLGKTVPEILGSFGEIIEQHLREARDSAKPVFVSEITGETPAFPGRQRWWLAQYFPLSNAQGQITHVGAVALDITERKQAEMAVRRAHEQTRYLVENTPLAVIERDGRYVVKSWNARAEQLFGWSADEVIGRSVDDLPLLYEDDRAKVQKVLRDLQRPETTYVFSANRNRTRDGRVVHCEWYNSVLHDEQGRIVTVMSLVLDVTKRTLTEEQLRDADRRKDVYLATLAHELRNPLAPIRNAVEVLRRKGADARVMWAGDVIDRQATQMARLLDDLLEISRITRGKVELRTARMALGDAVQDGIETSRPALQAARHHVEIDVPAAPVWVYGDRVRLAQVFANLLNNAAKYTNPGGHIRVRLTAGDDHANVSVTDDGVGIRPGMMQRIFEPFSQDKTVLDRAQGGLGIGLALVKGLVELHGGSVRASSDGDGRGAQFVVTLPLAPSLADAQSPPDAATVITLASDQTILVADDNIDAADTLAALLSSAGAKVNTAYDGLSALERARADPPHVAILDIGMPGLDGYDVARRLCALPRRPYLIAVTGWGQEVDRNTAADAGFDCHLTKPVDPLELLKLIARAIPPHAPSEPVHA